MDAGLVDEICAGILRALAAGERVEPPALQLLVRRYAATGREDLGAPLAAALAGAFGDLGRADHADLLALCADVSRVSDDEELAAIAADLAGTIRASWTARATIADTMRGIDACLQAADLAGAAEVVPPAIDELERIVGREYEPGEGLGAGSLADHMSTAAALLTAYDRTGRLPYAMLADELVQASRRRWWRADSGRFDDVEPLAGNCAAARVCCRLAALHADTDYRDAAVIAPGADYAADAGRALAAEADVARARGPRAAVYALALADWLALRDGLQ